MKKLLLLYLFFLLPLTIGADNSGVCGDNLTWSFSEKTKTLTISGNGDMRNYNNNNPSPWYSFNDNIKNVLIENGVSTIGNYAFSNCRSINKLTLPNSIKVIGDYAFDFCTGLTSVNISDLTSWCRIAFSGIYSNPLLYANHLYLNGQEVIDLIIPNSLSIISDYAFTGCSGLISVTIPHTIKSIGSCAFWSCDGLTSVTIPNSVTSIGTSAFAHCKSLTSISIPNSVERIENYTFEDCTSLTSVTIPNSITYIGERAFYDCKLLAAVSIGKSVVTIGNCAFVHCDELSSIEVDSENVTLDSRNSCNAVIETATNTLLFGCKSTFIPNSIIKIGDFAFQSCVGLKSINIPNSVTSIGINAFQSCDGLTSLTIPNSVTIINTYAVSYCKNLTSISIPNSVTKINDSAFSNCTALTSITIPNSVTFVGWRAFEGCRNLKKLIIGNSLNKFGNDAFCDSYELSDVYCYKENVPKSDYYIFPYSMNNTTLHVPGGSIGSYRTSDYWKNFKEIVALTDSDPKPTDTSENENEEGYDHKMVVSFKNGDVVSFVLKDKPEVTFIGNYFRVKTANNTIDYTRANIADFHFEGDASGVETVEYSGTGDVIIYNISGHVVAKQKNGDQESAKILLDSFKPGMYIIKIGNSQTIKYLKK